MSRKVSPRKVDRRVQRTQHILGDALVELMHRKPFNEITVQEVLDLAQVGRSTFYLHYRDKDDLFLSDAEQFFDGIANLLTQRGEVSKRVAPVREFFTHLAEVSEFYAALIAAGKVQDVMELAQGYFARTIEQRLAELVPQYARASASRAALSHALAGAMLSLLTWWIDHDKPTSPAEMDDIFHQMVWSGVAAATNQQPTPSLPLHCEKKEHQ
jgi:AcrR family transcriptional regulator